MNYHIEYLGLYFKNKYWSKSSMYYLTEQLFDYMNYNCFWQYYISNEKMNNDNELKNLVMMNFDYFKSDIRFIFNFKNNCSEVLC
jgi:hypothetical protein